MLSIEVTIEMTILMKKMTVPIFETANNFAYPLPRISFPGSTLDWHPNG